jgi:NADH-quinone oxidoreductase subunit M
MDPNFAQSWLQVSSTAGFPLLTTLCALPLLFALIGLLLPGDQPWAHKALGFVGSIATFLFSLLIFARVDTSHAGLQQVDDFRWIDWIGAHWTMGVDGLSLPLIMLTTLLTPIVFMGAWSSIDKRWKEFSIAMLVLETGMLGSLCATDLLTFYLFWEVMLVPMYLIIGIWGGKDRIYATLKFFLYTMFGSMLMLVAILYLYTKAHGTFSLLAITQLQLTEKEQIYLFAAFALAFLIKVPLFPFHTWLPDAHTEAPTPGSVILAGVMLKLGTYGLLRFAVPMFPGAMGYFSPLLLILSVIGIVFGALMAYVQTDIKRLVAYSSVSHLGFVMLGIVIFNQESLQGAMLQMVNHGLSTGALFLLVGFVYERRHTREISDFGGIAKRMPVYAGFFVFITLSSIALPLTNGFVGEFLIFAGSFKEGVHSAIAHDGKMGWRNLVLIMTGIATLGIVLGAVYMLSMVRRVFFGPITKAANEALTDLTLRERLIMSILCILIVWIGIAPAGWLKLSDATVAAMVAPNRPQIMQVRSPIDYQRQLQQQAAAP